MVLVLGLRLLFVALAPVVCLRSTGLYHLGRDCRSDAYGNGARYFGDGGGGVFDARCCGIEHSGRTRGRNVAFFTHATHGTRDFAAL